ncbi:MAG: FAD-binding oxidoreductase [Caldilineaceae bacterium]
MTSSHFVLTDSGRSGAAETAVTELANRLRGPLLRPGQAEYEVARRIWNGQIDRRPAIIVRCTGVADVIQAVNFARTHGLRLAVRGGGHNVAGLAVCDDGMMLDLSLLKGIHVDPAARTARAQPGVAWGELDRETQIFGLATPGGFVSTTGIGGLTLGGGFGWMSRKHGFTVDNLLAADAVTADGRFLTASAEENSDLFWGLRGGGGNFGVVTSFHYRLHSVGPIVVAGMILYPMEQATEVLRFYREFSAAAPDELGTMAMLRCAPPAPFLPREIHGKPVVGIVVCYVGSLAVGEQLVRPLKEFGKPIVDLIGPKPYTAHQTLFDAGVPNGNQYYWKSEYLPSIADEAIETVIHFCERPSSPQTLVVLFQLGGAISRAAADITAVAHRDAAYVLNIASNWTDCENSDTHKKWTLSFWEAMQPHAAGGVYVNFLSQDEGEVRVRSAYGTNYGRLVALKNKYDPSNFFNLNQNIRPNAQN